MFYWDSCIFICKYLVSFVLNYGCSLGVRGIDFLTRIVCNTCRLRHPEKVWTFLM